MKIVCLGGGPSGLYFAISMKLRHPDYDIEVYERHKAGDTFGWGVVFSDQTLENLQENDPKSAHDIANNFAHWDDIDVHFKDEVITTGGHGFVGIGRKRLLQILQDRAKELGITQVFEYEVEVDDIATRFKDADLIIASDGINSKVRTHYQEHFDVDIERRANKFVWLGTHKVFDAFTFIFKETEHGWVWAHAYRYDKETSTFIVECSEDTWAAIGFDDMSQDENSHYLEELFADHLDGHSLMSNAKHLRGSAWLNFNRVICNTWHYKNIVLLGDAAHTAHFSIGSGTKLGFEDAICLATVLDDKSLSTEDALEQYKDVRNLEVLKIQNAARNSTEWFETLDRYLPFDAMQFTYSLLTRSQRVSHENLRLRDPKWLEQAERWFATRAAQQEPEGKTPPPMFTPFTLRDMTLENRVVVSPMCMYSATDGVVNDFHLVHYGARAMGGAGLVYTEMTDVSADARITPGCAGLWNDDHTAAWKRITDYVHQNSSAKMCVQLGHAGPKGSTKLLWDGMDQPLDDGSWPIMSASATPYSKANETPHAMTRADMDRVKADFVAATKRAHDAGFDMVEFHAAHGYLMSAFITPLLNRREDDYGGTLENRLKYPLEVFSAMRAIWPDNKPMSVRISASDWGGDNGITADDAAEIAAAFSQAGADIIDVSAGQTSADARPVYGRMFQTPFADKIRNEKGIATMAVGNIFEADHVNSIIMAGRADLCALARPHLMDPNWTIRAAAELGWHGLDVPKQYQSGFDQLERNLERARMMEGQK